jgi:hypothetical protein
VWLRETRRGYSLWLYFRDCPPLPLTGNNIPQKDSGYLPHQGYPKPGHGPGTQLGPSTQAHTVYPGDPVAGGGIQERRQVSPPLHINVCGQVRVDIQCSYGVTICVHVPCHFEMLYMEFGPENHNLLEVVWNLCRPFRTANILISTESVLNYYALFAQHATEGRVQEWQSKLIIFNFPQLLIRILWKGELLRWEWKLEIITVTRGTALTVWVLVRIATVNCIWNIFGGASSSGRDVAHYIVPCWRYLLGLQTTPLVCSQSLIADSASRYYNHSITLDSDPLMSCVRAVFRCPHASKAGR